ncbi:O-methyltransferase gsfB [Fusarium culmorum]|uniref:O-methyltransferase gsfB n=1 Tax=Fusarium culmorum TaxID=5516 RepID=A0A2T4GJT9_FUSCU|nr:O-methyltransferase gsfB [Fusarium culmorum]
MGEEELTPPYSHGSPSLETSLMVQLARKIAEETEKLDNYFKSKGLPDLGFDVNAPNDLPKLPEDIQKCRLEISSATKQLELLVRGPRETIRWGIWSYLDTLSLQILNSYKIYDLVPLDEPISLRDLQTRTTLDSVNLARALRHAMTNSIFQEPMPGFIAHSAASKILAQDSNLQAWVGLNGEDFFPAGAHTLEALRADPKATSLTRTGFNHAWGTVDKEPMFATFGKDPHEASDSRYDFSDVNVNEGTFVDVGGSHGFVCVDLARKWSKMKFVVQDLPKTVSSAPNPICEDEGVAQRISLQAHDFFTEQPVRGADVFYFRWIFHNLASHYAVTILKNLIPALKPGARILINDHCLREPGVEHNWDEKLMRSMDLLMLTLLNSQERTGKEFEELFKAADERFVFKGVTRLEGCRMSIIEAVWQP